MRSTPSAQLESVYTVHNGHTQLDPVCATGMLGATCNFLQGWPDSVGCKLQLLARPQRPRWMQTATLTASQRPRWMQTATSCRAGQTAARCPHLRKPDDRAPASDCMDTGRSTISKSKIGVQRQGGQLAARCPRLDTGRRTRNTLAGQTAARCPRLDTGHRPQKLPTPR